MARHVRARDRTCAAPWCSAPARACEIDHTVPFGDPSTASGTGGRTATDNLGPLCKRDHLLKTHAGFGLVQDAPGTFTWTTPTGQRIRRRPRPVGRPAGPPPSTTDQLRTVRTYVADALDQPIPEPEHTGAREDPPF